METNYQEISTPDPDVEDTDDGGALVNLADEEKAEEVAEFYDNLVPKLDTSMLSGLALELIRDIELDESARNKRNKTYEDALKRTGLAGESVGGASFTGASRVVHPMLAKGAVDFAARASKELLPASNIVKDYIPGKQTRDRMEKAQRKVAHMNWQLKTQMPEFRTEMEQLLTQLPLGGSQYLGMQYDPELKRPVAKFWSIDEVLLPEAATNFYTSERMTLVEMVTNAEYKRRFEIGLYHGDPAPASSLAPEKTAPGQEQAKIEGKEETGFNIDGVRKMYRVRYRGDLEKMGSLPYIVEVDPDANRIVSVIRNWDEKDEQRKQMDWVIDFTFMYWKGATGIGLFHLISSLSIASTGALRAVLDSAHINNMPTLIRLRGANVAGQSLTLAPGEVIELEGGVATDDIRKLLMPVPFNPPSVVLLQLIGLMSEMGENMVRTTFEGFADGRSDMPVGTMMALIEQGMKVLGAIHLRLYSSLTRVLEVLARINRMYLESEDIAVETGEVLARREDYQGPNDVIPVADPETFSDVQRMAQVQMISQRAMLLPQLYDMRKVEEMILERSKIPNAKDLLVPAPKPKIMNPVNENAAMALGQPVTAHPEQDHLAHIQVLADFALSPIFGGNPLIAPQFLPPALGHMKEHIIYHYVQSMKDAADSLIEGGDITQAMKHEDFETRAEVDRLMAAISQEAVPQASQTFSGLMPKLQMLVQMAQQMSPQMPQDPHLGAAAIQAQTKDKDRAAQQQTKQAELQQRAQSEQSRVAADLQKAREKYVADAQARREQAMQSEMQREHDASQREEDRTLQQQLADLDANVKTELDQNDTLRQQQELAAKEAMNDQDNQVALTIAQAEIESGERVAVKNGKNVGPGK